ncbi:hypothetical protein D3C71_872900 [compost metagenome]
MAVYRRGKTGDGRAGRPSRSAGDAAVLLPLRRHHHPLCAVDAGGVCRLVNAGKRPLLHQSETGVLQRGSAADRTVPRVGSAHSRAAAQFIWPDGSGGRRELVSGVWRRAGGGVRQQRADWFPCVEYWPAHSRRDDAPGAVWRGGRSLSDRHSAGAGLSGPPGPDRQPLYCRPVRTRRTYVSHR